MLASDHGFIIGEHGYTGKSSALLHPELTRVPLVIVDPGASARARRASTSTPPTTSPPRSCPWSEWRHQRRWTGRTSPVCSPTSRPRPGDTPTGAIRTASISGTPEWALSGVNLPGDFQLYDLEADPGETRNLAARDPQTALELYGLVKRRAGGRLPYYPDV